MNQSTKSIALKAVSVAAVIGSSIVLYSCDREGEVLYGPPYDPEELEAPSIEKGTPTKAPTSVTAETGKISTSTLINE